MGVNEIEILEKAYGTITSIYLFYHIKRIGICEIKNYTI